MAQLTIVWIIAVMSALMCVLAKEEMYSDQYDDIDVEEVLKSQALRDMYFYCFMEKIPCETPQQKYLTGIYDIISLTDITKFFFFFVLHSLVNTKSNFFLIVIKPAIAF